MRMLLLRLSVLLLFGFAAVPAYARILPRLSITVKKSSVTGVVRRAMAVRPSRRSIRQSAQPVLISPRPLPAAAAGSSVSSKPGVPVFDQDTDAVVRPGFLLLDATSPALAGVRFFSEHEPVHTTSITVTLAGPVDTVDSMLIYDQGQRFLGQAWRNASDATHYTLRLSGDVLPLPYRVPVSIYVRARLRSHANGGTSGEDVQVSAISVEGDGLWSNNTVTNTSTDTFPAFQTARGAITSVTSVGGDGALGNGTAQLLSTFRFQARTTDEEARVQLQSLRFAALSSQVTLTNVRLRVEGSHDDTTCTVVSTVITCSSLPASHGVIDPSLTLQVYGDIAVASGAGNPFLRLMINDPGSPGGGGDITWTDGEATFDWVGLPQPVARGMQLQ